MKLAVAVCVALLAVVMVQAEHEMSLPVREEGTRIFEGRPAMPKQFPYMAYIESKVSPGAEPKHCGGSLITRNAVLTKADCIVGWTNYTVRLGSIHRTAEDRYAWTVVSTWAVTHPKYNSSDWSHNLGLIFLPKKAPINDYIQVVELPTSPLNASFLGCTGIVSGWGSTSEGSELSEVLRWSEVTVIPNEICANFFPKHGVTERRLCAGYQAVMGAGDWGIPLVLRYRGRYLHIGIQLRRQWDSSDITIPSLYERVDSYIRWIRLKTGMAHQHTN